MLPMLSRLLGLFRKQPVVVHGTDKLPEGRSKKVEFGDPWSGGVQVVLVRLDGQLHALDTRCPHEGGRIVDGPLAQGKYVVCPLHNYHFDPKTGGCVGAACKNAKTYKVVENGADAKLWL